MLQRGKKRLKLKRRWALTTFFISMRRYGIGDMGYGRRIDVKIFSLFVELEL